MIAHPTPAPRPPGRAVLAFLAFLGAVLVLVTVTPAPAADAAEPDPVGTWPLRAVPREPDVVHDFDPPEVRWGSGHRGVDLAGAAGQVVRAALPGTVTHAGAVAGVGVVVVDHGPTRTTYQPVDAAVADGDVVRAGEPIGRLALPGSHCAPAACLHWGWVQGEVYLDPLRLVGVGPVRLLPLWRDLPRQPVGAAGPGTVLGSAYAGWRPAADLTPAGGPAGRPGADAPW